MDFSPTVTIRDHGKLWKPALGARVVSYGRRRLRYRQKCRAGDLNLVTTLMSKITNVPVVASMVVLAFGGGSFTFLKQARGSGDGRKDGNSRDPFPWMLTLQPTPFNKFVVARCPSIRFDSESVHQKLHLGDRQLVSLKPSDPSDSGGRIEFQRKCILSDDGGVLALDWPVFLDIEGDHGLDTTLLLVPGTAKGSTDDTLRTFSRSALDCGFFPIILNPRGCGGSPLTTPRIYTAADSDDVRAAVAHIFSCRPWTTMMGIGWGYGANMITKYLAEDASSTPIAAAVCVNNPFNLEDSTKYIRRNRGGVLDKELTQGFIDILKANKMIFQGDFDVADGLTATSVREFDEAISTSTHGFKSVERFYASASSGALVDEVKLPLLCIQDASVLPLFSIPQVALEANPCTTLLYTSTQPDWSSTFNVALEWLAAVEVALLKGRHPLLQCVDLRINPSKDLMKKQSSSGKALMDSRFVQEGDYVVVEPEDDFWTPQEDEMVEEQLTSPPEAVENQTNPQEGAENAPEIGQVQQAAQSVFGALDVVLPGTMTEDVKKQVLEAVGRGETIVTALQNAVPEDVRGKISTSVSAAVQARGISLQLVGFGKDMPPPTLPDGLKESINEKLKAVGFLRKTKERERNGDSNGSSNGSISNGDSNGSPVSESNNNGNSNANTETEGDNVVSDVSSNNEPGSSSGSTEPNANAKGEQGESKVDSDETSKEKPNEQQDEQEQKKVDIPSGGGDQGPKMPDHGPVTPPPVDMKQAFEALTGFDDSTQMAVNSVFGVLEELLEKMEKEHEEQQKQNKGENPSLVEQHYKHGNGNGDRKAPEERNRNQVKGSQSRNNVEGTEDLHSRLRKTKIYGFVLRRKNSVTGDQSRTLALDAARAVVLDAMKVEVQKRLRRGAIQLDDFKELKNELLEVADAIVEEVKHVHVKEDTSLSHNVLPAEELIDATATAVGKTSLLRKLVPIGVLVGVVLASLATAFHVVRSREGVQRSISEKNKIVQLSTPEGKSQEREDVQRSTKSSDGVQRSTPEYVEVSEAPEVLHRPGIVGAMTAAMGATAAFASTPFQQHQDHEASSDGGKEGNFASSIAEKALAIAGPVVPTKDGGVDQDRLVAMLADLGNKAGFLKFLGKAALLWGGLRGAMNVTDRLLMFLHMAERPLPQRLVGFVGMLVIVWSPVVLPLLPTLLSEWASKSTTPVATYASLIGLYGALFILITIWGKKIRGYEQPLREYGLRLEKWNTFVMGALAGCAAVTFVYTVFAQLGYVQFSGSLLPSDSISQLAFCIFKCTKLGTRALLVGISVSVVEELVFRSWLFEELAADIGHHRAIIVSALVFAVLRGSPPAIPGLWFLAVALAGARTKLNGDLSLSIGVHAGLVATNVVFNSGGFVSYLPGSSNWVTGLGSRNPVAGMLGTSLACMLAAIMYPWKLSK